jgi:hypothetical protein
MIFQKQECIRDWPDCGRVSACITKMGWLYVADAISSRILSEPRAVRLRRQRSNSGRIALRPVFAQGLVIFALWKSWHGSSRRCCLQLLLGFCADLFSDNAGASRPAETTTLTHSITPSVGPSHQDFPTLLKMSMVLSFCVGTISLPPSAAIQHS